MANVVSQSKIVQRAEKEPVDREQMFFNKELLRPREGLWLWRKQRPWCARHLVTPARVLLSSSYYCLMLLSAVLDRLAPSEAALVWRPQSDVRQNVHGRLPTGRTWCMSDIDHVGS